MSEYQPTIIAIEKKVYIDLKKIYIYKIRSKASFEK